MTRCLDCGAERLADQCPSCGLTSAAAEVMFRRRLYKRTAVFLAGSILFPYLSQWYPPLDLDWMLIFFGILFFLVLALAVFIDRRARQRAEIEKLKHVYSGFIPLPWILAIMLVLNGKFDSTKNVDYHQTTVDGRYNMPGMVLRVRRISVSPSWRPGKKHEELAVDFDDYDRFHTGDSVEVGVKPGAFGIPWYYGVYRR